MQYSGCYAMNIYGLGSSLRFDLVMSFSYIYQITKRKVTKQRKNFMNEETITSLQLYTSLKRKGKKEAKI